MQRWARFPWSHTQRLDATEACHSSPRCLNVRLILTQAIVGRTSGSLRSRGWREKGWGQGSNRKAPIGTPFLLSNLSRHKKSNSLIPKDILRERKEVIGRPPLCRSFSSSKAQQSSAQSSLCCCTDCVSSQPFLQQVQSPTSSEAQVSLFILPQIFTKQQRFICTCIE